MAPKRVLVQSKALATSAWKRSPHAIVGVGVSSFIVVFGIIAYLFFFLAPHDFPSEKIFEVKKGVPLRTVADALHEGRVIRAPALFTSLVKIGGKEREVKAGLYYFERPLSLIDVMYRLTDGRYEVAPLQATIKEGATIFGMGLFFEERGMFSAEDFWKKAGFAKDHYGNGEVDYGISGMDVSDFPEVQAVKPADEGLEGFLFPDTYFFPPAVTPEAVVRAMLENFERKVTPELYKAAEVQGKDFYDVLIMASMIERETSGGEDSEIISGILWKRLEEHYPLQVDAVLAYITGRGSFDLRIDDLDIDSPYNVYKRIGLPPTPISNPGLESIQAALFPKETEYWYYLHDANGNAYYAQTFDAHKENKIKYLR